MRTPGAWLLPAAWLLAACAEGESAAVRWEATVDTVADTVVVRTLAGSEWSDTMHLVPEVRIGVLDGPPEYMFGNVTSLGIDREGRIWAVDRQVPELRVFGPGGGHVMTVGQPGEGPGELKGPDGGLQILSDGRVLVRDPGNARIQVYSADGEALDTWTIRGGFFTSNPLYRDREDNVYTQLLLEPGADVSEWRRGLLRIGPDGEPLDTLPEPDAGFEPPSLIARTENSASRTGVPFAPDEHTSFHPDGYWVHGIADDYDFTLLKDPSTGELPVRVERVYEPVPVASGEAVEERRRVTRQMRSVKPDWSWDGPDIPDTKPAFRDILVARDGRVWVRVSTPGYRTDDPEYDPTDPDDVPDEWHEPVAFDVYEPDGTYLGHVVAPPDFDLYPHPIIDGDRVWAVASDDLGVERIVRYRIAPRDGS